MGCTHANSSHHKQNQNTQTDFTPSQSPAQSAKKPASKMKYPPNLSSAINFSGGLDITIPDRKLSIDQISDNSTEPPLIEELCIQDIDDIEQCRKAPISACSSRSSFSFISPLHTEHHINNPPQFNFESPDDYLLPQNSDSPRLLSLSPYIKTNVFSYKKVFSKNFEEVFVGQPSDFKLDEFPAEEPLETSFMQKETPVQERLRSSSWSIRAKAYDELAMTFEQCWDDEIFEKYSKTVIENITDFNPKAQRRALETLKVYLSESDCTHLSPKVTLKVLIKRAFKKSFEDICFEIVYFLFEKCDKKELIESLTNLIGSKNPKVQVTALRVLTDLLSKYGCENFEDYEILFSAVCKQAMAANLKVRAYTLNFFEESYSQLGNKKTLPYILKLKTPQLKLLDKLIFEKQAVHILPQNLGRAQRSLKTLRPVLKLMNPDLIKPLKRLRSDKKPWKKLPRIKEEVHEEEKIEKVEERDQKEPIKEPDDIKETALASKNMKRKSCQMVGGSQNLLEKMRRVRRSDVR